MNQANVTICVWGEAEDWGKKSIGEEEMDDNGSKDKDK